MIIHRAIISATSKPVIFYTLFCYNVPFFNINRISIAAWSLDCKSEANWYWKLVNTNFFQTNFPRRYLLYIVDVFGSINLPNIMIYFFLYIYFVNIFLIRHWIGFSRVHILMACEQWRCRLQIYSAGSVSLRLTICLRTFICVHIWSICSTYDRTCDCWEN